MSAYTVSITEQLKSTNFDDRDWLELDVEAHHGATHLEVIAAAREQYGIGCFEGTRVVGVIDAEDGYVMVQAWEGSAAWQKAAGLE